PACHRPLPLLGALVAEAESRQVEQCLPPEVQYACLYWVEHLKKSGTQLHDSDRVYQFLQTLEALSWMWRMSEGILAIRSLKSIALVNPLLAHQEHASNPRPDMRLYLTIRIHSRYEAIRPQLPVIGRTGSPTNIL